MKTKFCLVFVTILFILSFAAVAFAQTGTVYFKDDFNYSSLAHLKAAGWTVDNPASISFASSAVVFDTTKGDSGIHYATSFSSDVFNWKAESKSMWMGKGHSVLTVAVATERHLYGWTVDGYYKYFSLYRDSTKILHFGNYAEKANQYIVLTMVRQDNTFSLYFNGELMNTYTEQDTTLSKVTRLDVVGPWQANAKYDYIMLGDPAAASPTSPSTTATTSSFPMIPVIIGGTIAAAVVAGILVYYFVIAGGSAASSAGSAAGAAGSVGSSGSTGGGELIHHDQPTSPLRGEAAVSPLSGISTGGFFNSLMSNITDSMSIVEDILNGDLSAISSLSSIGATVLQAATETGTGSTSTFLSQLPEVKTLVDSLMSQGEQLLNEGTTQNSINQDTYQQYLQQVTNLVDTITQIISTQTSTDTGAALNMQ